MNTDFFASFYGKQFSFNLLRLTDEPLAYNAPVMSRTQLRLWLLLLLLTEEGAVRA
jgi:hypothetical protein